MSTPISVSEGGGEDTGLNYIHSKEEMGEAVKRGVVVKSAKILIQ